MSKGKVPHLFADFNNADPLGRIRLQGRGTADELIALDVKLSDGLNVVLYDGDEFEADGTVHLCPIEGRVATIDWKALRPIQH